MNLLERTAFFTERVTKIVKLSHLKGQAYADEMDALSNFKEQAEKLDLTPFQIWNVFFDKHIRAIEIAIRNRPHYPIESIEGMNARLVRLRKKYGVLSTNLFPTATPENAVHIAFKIHKACPVS